MDAQMIENFFKLGVNLLVILWLGVNACGWCRDPLATKLQQKIKELEEEIDNLNNTIKDCNEERDFLLTRLNSVYRHVRALHRSVTENSDSDTDCDSQSGRKRPRCNT